MSLRSAGNNVLRVMVAIAVVAGLCPGAALAEGNRAGDLAAQAMVTPQAGASIESATAIALNRATTGMLTGEYYDDEGNQHEGNPDDWYKITIPSSGKFWVSMSGDYRARELFSDKYWKVSLRDAQDKEIWTIEHSATLNLPGKSSSYGTVGLPAGTYYIHVYDSWGSASDLSYTFTPSFESRADWEVEFNDSIVTANAIPLGRMTYGTMRVWDSDTDEDWYRVVVPADGRFEIVMAGDYGDGVWDVSLRDEDNQELWRGEHRGSNNLPGKTSSLCAIGIPVGTYYICVSGNGGSATYSLLPMFKPKGDWETELNDTIMTADAIPFGKTTHGTMRGDSDEDWYKVSYPVNGPFAVRFSGGYSSSTDSWKIGLYDDRGKNIKWWNYAESTSRWRTLKAADLAAGSYYICVSADGWDDLTGFEYSLVPDYYAPGTKVKRLTAGWKSFTVKWKKTAKAKKYQVRYSTKKSMAKAKVVNVSKKKTIKTVQRLKANKKYWVQVRVARTVNGKLYYSSWTAAQYVKTWR